MTNATQAEYTPGPWGLRSKEPLGATEIVTQSLRHVATVWPIESLQSTAGRPVTEKLATADLIAAAPELLDALRVLTAKCAEWGEEGHTSFCSYHFAETCDCGVTEARAAIAKATGAAR